MILGEVVSDLKDLTPLILGVLAFIAVLVFRQSVRAALTRLTELTLRRGETELQAKTPQPDSDDADAEAVESPAPEGEGKQVFAEGREKREEISEEAPTSPEALRAAMLTAVFRRDREAAEKFRRELRAKESDAKERKLDDARWHGALYGSGLGGDEDLKILERLAEDEDVRPNALYFIGVGLERGAQLKEAADKFLEAASASADPEQKARAIVQAAEATAKAGDVHAGTALIKKVLRTQQDSAALAELWEGLASVLESDSEDSFRPIALQKLAEINANDAEARFDAGYAYGQADMAVLAMHNYELTLAFDPEHSSALNNYGVELTGQGLDLPGVDFYKRAVDKQHTLAMANLAYKLIHEGFEAEAKEFLEKAHSEEDPHENVASATAKLASDRTDQDSARKSALASGQKLAAFMSDYADAWLEDRMTVAGEWKWTSGTPVSINQDGDSVTIEWKTATEKKKRFKGSIQGGTAKGEFQDMRYLSTSGDEFGWASGTPGFIRRDGKKLMIAEIKDTDVTLRELTPAES